MIEVDGLKDYSIELKSLIHFRVLEKEHATRRGLEEKLAVGPLELQEIASGYYETEDLIQMCEAVEGRIYFLLVLSQILYHTCFVTNNCKSIEFLEFLDSHEDRKIFIKNQLNKNC